MKSIAALIFCLVTIGGFCQQKSAPTYYMNSQEIDFENVYVKPANIDSMRVAHKTTRGEIYIWVNKPITFLSLETILKNKSGLANAGTVVYVVNGKVITDKSVVKIDATYKIEVELTHLDGVNYVDKKYQDLTVAQITLKPEASMKIRGFQHTALID